MTASPITTHEDPQTAASFTAGIIAEHLGAPAFTFDGHRILYRGTNVERYGPGQLTAAGLFASLTRNGMHDLAAQLRAVVREYDAALMEHAA